MTVGVLILCTHNSARSVLAEGMLNHWAGRLAKDVRAFSAGSHPSGMVQPVALDVLRAAGVDTSNLRSKSWDEFCAPGAPPVSIVITVCDAAASEACPVFFGSDERLRGPPTAAHWSYSDPSHGGGSEAARRQAFDLTRQAIAYRMLRLLALPLDTMDRAALHSALMEIGRC